MSFFTTLIILVVLLAILSEAAWHSTGTHPATTGIFQQPPQQQWSICTRTRNPCNNQWRRLPLFALDKGIEDQDQEEQDYFTVQVSSHEGLSCDIRVRPEETILSAMERVGADVPSDCRRGNCLTCTGRHSNGSNESSLKRLEDGLSPYISSEVQKRGYILTCSSHVVGDGIKLQLDKNHAVWNDIYKVRLEDESAQLAGRIATANVIRLADENNPKRWAVETETALKNSGDGE
jgi:ferredoxin